MSSNGFLETAVTFVVWFLLFYYWHGVGITLGYHRLLTHRSLKVPEWIAYFWVAGAYFCLMGSPIVWVGVHRLHHQKSDQEGDPHSPIHGFKHALYEWMFDMRKVQSDEELRAQVPDLLKNPLYRVLGSDHSPWQAQLCLTLNILWRVVLYLVAGPVVLLADLLAISIVFWSPQLVNAVCHLEGVGYRSHETRDLSRNVWWVGILAVGEGWHNNHHAFPKSARHGMQWFEIDLTWYTIWLLEKLGLATNVVRPPLTDRSAMRKPEAKSASFLPEAPLSILPQEATPEPVLAVNEQ